jgi:hypothetical protein
MKSSLFTSVRIAPLIMGLLTSAGTLRAQTVATNDPSIAKLTNVVLYATDFKDTTYNNYSGGASGSYTYTSNANGGTVVTGANFWATLTSGQDGWQTLGISQQGYGPGVIINSSAVSYRNNPYLNVLGGDALFSTDIANPQTYPQSQTTYLAQSRADTPYNQIHFESTFWINATAPNSNGDWDTLGWSLLNSANQNLMSINLNTIDGGANWQLSATPFGSTNKQVLTKFNGTALESIAEGQVVHLGFNIYNLGTDQSTIEILNYSNIKGTNIPTPVSGTLLGRNVIQGGVNSANILGGNQISSLAATWTLASSDNQVYTDASGNYTGFYNYADNSLVMSTLLITVPEPQAWVLMGISGLIMVVAFRRKKA